MDEQDLYPIPDFGSGKTKLKTPQQGDVLVARVNEMPWGLDSSIKLDIGKEYKVLAADSWQIVIGVGDINGRGLCVRADFEKLKLNYRWS